MAKQDQEPERVFELTLTVSAKDIDNLNHVNNVVYLQWVQDIASAHWDTIATNELKKKYSWVVLRHEIDYRNPAYLGDQLLVKTWVSSCEGVRSVRHVKFYQASSGVLVVETKTTWCLLDAQTMRPKRIEPDIKSIFLNDKS
jgi:acyl-CoA thioester hydrolase